MLYSLFYWIHIVSYLSWLAAFAGSIFFATKVRSVRQLDRRRTFMRLERLVTDIGAHVGAVGILISGSAMASLSTGPQWGWFPIQLYPWLAIKQVIFGVILILVALSIRRSRIFRRAWKQEASEDALSKRWSSAYRLSLLVSLLVIVNTFLGLVKPY